MRENIAGIPLSSSAVSVVFHLKINSKHFNNLISSFCNSHNEVEIYVRKWDFFFLLSLSPF